MAKSRGQPASCRLPEGPGKPERRLLANFLPARTRPNSPCAGGAAPGGPRGAPAGPSGVSRQPRRAPPASLGRRAHPETGAGQGERAGRSAPPRVSEASVRAPGQVRPFWSRELLGPSPPDPDPDPARPGPVHDPGSWRSRANSWPDASLCRRSRGPRRHRDSHRRRGPKYEPLRALPALAADRPRSPGAPRTVSAPASSAREGRDLCREGAS